MASQITLGEGEQSKRFCIKNDQVFFSFNFNWIMVVIKLETTVLNKEAVLVITQD